ncbi:endochitinase A-like [Anopheles arabiensis]|uniref:endochitinase A-like n=1 Tax=Anopheles arabiensis TaxID=7173 RepID=UPI001AAD2FA7|nr:endochitinase A-like [Anopheles arabiensis]
MEAIIGSYKNKKNPIQATEKVLHLIQLVGTYPCLWKDSERQYKNQEISHQAWREIGAALNEKLEDAQEKWKNLMNTYRCTKKEIARSQTTGSGASKILQDVWYGYEAMSFLHDTVVPRRTLNSANLVKTPTASTSNACSTTTSTAAPTATSTSIAAPTATSTSTAAPTATSTSTAASTELPPT